MAPTRQLLLGAFFVIVFGILGAYTLFFTDVSFFEERHELVVHFPDANGLRKGDSVLVAGIREGRVQAHTYDPRAPLERRITVTLTLDHEVVLREGFDIAIEDATVLGGKQVTIDPGPPEGAEVAIDGPLPGHVRGGPLEGLGDLVERNGSSFEALVTDLSEVAAALRSSEAGVLGRLINDAEFADEFYATMDDARTSFDNIDAVTTELREGKGVIGRLVRDEDLANELDEVVANLQQITTDFKAAMADVQSGKGTLGMLAKDEELAADVREAVDTIRGITERIEAGDGALWKLLEDEELARKLQELGGKLDQGTLGKLLTNDEIYVKLSQVADDVAAATAAIRNAEGALGKFVMKDDLYEQIERALRILTRTLQEYREAAPITTFASILGAGF
jgi:phospholipid/cholesterol/gamma-HCH transport system substrate-binding protein